MTKLRALGAALLVATAAFATPADDAAQRKDLAAVIALQGFACGEVVRFETKGEKDFIATCKDRNRYRVFVNPDGRVIVKKQ